MVGVGKAGWAVRRPHCLYLAPSASGVLPSVLVDVSEAQGGVA